MVIRWIAMLSFFIFSTGELLFSEEESIVVELETESQLLPVYLPQFWAEQAKLSPDYLAELEKTLRFDLSYNGMTHVKKQAAKLEKRARETGFSGADDLEKWKSDEFFYLIKVEVKGRKVSARLVSLANSSVKGVQQLSLTGDASHDRRQMHRLADLIHQTLFDRDGIAMTKLLYTVREKGREGKWFSEVWESDWDGKNSRRVTQDGYYCVSPTYMPPQPGYNSGSFFYVSYKLGQPKIFIKSLRGEKAHRLTGLRGNQLMPAVSANRRQVAFVSDVTGNPDLFLQPFSPDSGPLGKPYQLFASRRGTQASPEFSPDGKQIVFVSNKDGSPRIYVMEVPPPGSSRKQLAPTLLTRRNRENTAPTWSADGSKLAYSSKIDGTRQIWVYDFATGKERQLTKGAGHKENPTWAPNGLHLIFNSANKESSELFLVNLNQPEAVQISEGPGEKRFPSWEPRAK